jgi:hypothetical protein
MHTYDMSHRVSGRQYLKVVCCRVIVNLIDITLACEGVSHVRYDAIAIVQ